MRLSPTGLIADRILGLVLLVASRPNPLAISRGSRNHSNQDIGQVASLNPTRLLALELARPEPFLLGAATAIDSPGKYLAGFVPTKLLYHINLIDILIMIIYIYIIIIYIDPLGERQLKYTHHHRNKVRQLLSEKEKKMCQCHHEEDDLHSF